MTRVLIADDNLQNLYLLESILKGYHYEVVKAVNGAVALDAARKNPPDLIIADILMPVMDGFELCRQWKADERLAGIPFIFYTATYTDPKDEAFAKSLGAERFIVKPQKPDILGRMVLDVLEEAKVKNPAVPVRPLGDEMEVLRQYNETLFRKLEKKVLQLEAEIAEHQRTEYKLRASEKFLNNIVDHIPDMIVVRDAKDLRFVRLNKAGEDLLGHAQQDVLGKTDYDLYPKPEADRFVAKDREVLRANQVTDISEELIRTRNKGERLLHTKKIPINDDSGSPRFLLDIAEDITDRKWAEEKLLESEVRYRQLYESMRDAFARVDMAGRIVEYNNSFREMLGYPAEELVRLTYLDVTPEKWHAFEQYIIQTQVITAGYSSVYEKEYRKKDGTVFPVELRVFLIRDSSGQPSGMWGIVRDITGRKLAEEKIRLTTRKLMLMNDVTYQDIQNKITGLRGYAELSRNAKSEEERLFFIDKELLILETIHNLIRKTKEYQQMGTGLSCWTPLEQTIREQSALQSQKHALSLDMKLDGLELDSDPLIDRVFYNIIHNTLQHGMNATRFSVGYREASDGLVIICEDDGAGIPLENKAGIFERIAGGGGKFGLFFVQEFLSTSGMTIRENGEPGKGARFEITVPKGLYRFAGKD
jgi:PAS domain S-box-containing protein